MDTDTYDEATSPPTKRTHESKKVRKDKKEKRKEKKSKRKTSAADHGQDPAETRGNTSSMPLPIL